ncbi:pleiotropic drug resistance ABC transporter [Phlegmacium glaucopus]|nr:pleiotropic drug resistance ABC transporter [Phlegmacium glaucopus]
MNILDVAESSLVSQHIPAWMNYYLPGGIIIAVLLHDLASSISQPKAVRTAFRWLSSPFKNFLALEDLSEPVDFTPRWPNLKNRILVSLASASFVGWVGCLVFGVYMDDRVYAMKSMVQSASWCYIALRLILKPPLTPPYLFVTFALSSVLVSLVALGYDVLSAEGRKGAVVNIVAMIVPGTFAWLAGTLPLKPYRPSLNVARPKDIPSVTLSCPEDDVTLWSWSTFTFVQPILDLAMRKTLNDTDVWSLSPFFRHKNLFNKCLEYRAMHPTHSLLRFLLVSNSLDLIIDVISEMWSAVVGFVPPYALKEILSALASDVPEAKNRAYYWTLITFIAHLSFAQVDLFQSWHTRRCYERTRGQLFCTLHYKSLKRQEISGRVNREGGTTNADLGKIVNLMQGDSYAVAQRFWEFSAIFTSPVRITIALVFLYQILGWSALSGVVVFLVAAVLNYPLARYNISITRASWKARDERMNIVNELLQNIRFLKFYGWEYQWSRKAQAARETELKWRVKENIVDTLISFIWIWMPSATALTSFLCYTLIAGQRLTVSKAFTSIALFSQLQSPMVALPGQFFAMLHAYVSMQRIQDFLKEDEVPDWASTLSAPVPDSLHIADDKVGFSQASFEWEDPSTSTAAASPARFQLGPLNVVFPTGKLTVISGATGSGKSALLAALLGEMHCIAGRVLIDKTGHKVAYCAQNSWLEHATIKDNIIFGCPSPFDEARYQSVLDACALRQDLAIFDAGDMTEIGEKGITLSGGQRARIALARAMYSHAKCILLDDPLAAVDMHTAQHLVSKCLIGDLARGRTIILVTHHIAMCLPAASYLLELEKGTILHQGTIPELEERGLLMKVMETEEEPFSNPPSQDQKTFNEADILEDGTVQRQQRQLSDGKLVEAEARAEGRISARSYVTYIRAAGLFAWFLTIVLLFVIRAINIGNQVFLARWGEAYEGEYPTLFVITRHLASYPWTGLPSPDTDVKPWLMIYLYISAAGAFSVLLYIALGYYASLQASRSLFIALLQRLTRAPARFFDVTPVGRILNRFTTDINTIDWALQNSARNCLSGVLDFVASFGVILFVVPTFAPCAIFIAWLYIRLAPPYIQASRDLRRLESVSLSPAFAGFDELLRGIIHIRAFGMENRYQDRFYARVDKFQSFDHVYWLVNGWLRWRYDCLGSLVVFAATMFALWKGVADGSAAIVIVQAGIFADASRHLVRVVAQLELDFNSVERVVEYLDVPQEAPAVIEKNRPPAYWPSDTGELVVENLVVQYAPQLPAVLHDLTFTVKPSEKIGVVGRTGSGKSTLAMSLLRMVERTSGSIIIDGIDISTIGLEDLRTRVTIVSQDVSLFSGTIRSNLDPLGQSTTEECLQVLERCHLTPLLNHKPSADEPSVLDMQINQGSLSAGEKQLLALARATLRHTNIIIMDEATSQIDSNLDDQIQKTIREELANAIVITIAHRLKTVMDYDRILVLDEGNIVEFDAPWVLVQTPNGAFREMCRNSADWPLFLQMSKDRNGSSSEASV